MREGRKKRWERTKSVLAPVGSESEDTYACRSVKN